MRALSLVYACVLLNIFRPHPKFFSARQKLFALSSFSSRMNRKRGKYAGNFALLAGNNYSKRKSLPRDIHGFEPVEGYFNRRRDGDSGM